jgi:dolichol-phosphate mannosyltransferase
VSTDVPPLKTPRRAGWFALLGPLVDAVAFILFVRAGTHYGLAHILSFALAAVSGALVGRMTGAPPAVGTRPAVLLALDLMALLLRGGVLCCSSAAGSPALAILGAILASTLVTRRGRAVCAPAADSAGAATGWRALAIGLGLYALLLRLAYLASVDLFPEEAYYWNYAQHMDFGYLDHPPLVAWLIRCGTAVFGNTEFGVRAGAVLCMLVASYFVYRATRESYGRASAVVALVLMQLLPVYMLGGLLAPGCAADGRLGGLPVLPAARPTRRAPACLVGGGDRTGRRADLQVQHRPGGPGSAALHADRPRLAALAAALDAIRSGSCGAGDLLPGHHLECPP